LKKNIYTDHIVSYKGLLLLSLSIRHVSNTSRPIEPIQHVVRERIYLSLFLANKLLAVPSKELGYFW
jgi:hypothetical protein